MSKITLSLLLAASLFTSGTLYAEDTDSSELCTMPKKELRLLWMKVWEDEERIPCKNSEQDLNIESFHIAVETEVEEKCDDEESWLFGAIKWCTANN
jgi:hypothetical protein